MDQGGTTRSENTDFNFSEMDWEAYTAFRPAYPNALYAMIYAYQQSHEGAFGHALDVGAGIGIVAANLLEQFGHVTLSDASDLYLSQAQQFFRSRISSGLSFLHCSGEDLSFDLLPNHNQVDLITAGTCLHWTNVDVCTQRFASLLKPSGTFAAWVYGGRPIPLQTPASTFVRQLIDDIVDEFGRQYDKQIEDQQKNGAAAIINARYDNVSLDPELWEDVRRIHVNRKATMTCDWWPTAPSRVRPQESAEELEDQAFLSQDVDFEWFKGYLSNLYPVVKMSKAVVDKLAQLEAVMAGETIKLSWSFSLVLATKK